MATKVAREQIIKKAHVITHKINQAIKRYCNFPNSSVPVTKKSSELSLKLYEIWILFVLNNGRFQTLFLRILKSLDILISI